MTPQSVISKKKESPAHFLPLPDFSEFHHYSALYSVFRAPPDPSNAFPSAEMLFQRPNSLCEANVC